MSVTNYRPNTDNGCRYSYDKLENVVYLVSKEHVKNVHIDNGEAYINGLTESPIRLEGFNIQFTENSSLDERYKFTKQVNFSLHGYVPHTALNEKYYIILKSKDGTKWMVNVDFPSKVTYTFNLNATQYETDFTFSSLSNFPTLRLASSINEGVSPCKQLTTFGIKSLKLLEKDYCRLDTKNMRVYTYGEYFKEVEFLGDSCSLQQEFDGSKLTTKIDFDIAFDAYKSSWHYNLLEFLQNLYSSIIIAKGSTDGFFSGFNFGLQPSFNVSTTTQIGQSDVISVTLVESSQKGLTMAENYESHDDTSKSWIYVKNVGNIIAFECVGNGLAKYLLQQEINANGIPTGRYKVLEGYGNRFQSLNIVGSFTDIVTFSNSDCRGTTCQVITSLPISIKYYEVTCNTYTYSASCNWNVSGLANYMTVTPSNGVAGTEYELQVCNTKTPTTNETSTFTITAGDNQKIVNIFLTDDASILHPSTANIDCLEQNVRFTYDSTCPITITSIDSRLTYQLTNSQLIVTVPRNYSITNGIVWEIGIEDCNGNTQIVTINQNKTYENWVDTTGYLCDGRTSYVKQQRYTGTTSSNINTMTSETRNGAKIADDDPRCGTSQTRWSFFGHYYCVNGNKYKAEEEEESYDGGTTWTKTGVTRLGELVESNSSWCDDTLNPIEYKWEISTKWQCLSTQ